VITYDPIGVDGDRIILGEISEGIFIVEDFPEEIKFTIFLQIGFEPEDFGEHTLRVELCVLGGPRLADIVPDRTFYVAEPSDDWLLPVFKPVVVPFSHTANFNAGFDIVVFVDDEELGSKGIIIVEKSHIPDDLGEVGNSGTG
jgi:hypothetical protein